MFLLIFKVNKSKPRLYKVWDQCTIHYMNSHRYKNEKQKTKLCYVIVRLHPAREVGTGFQLIHANRTTLMGKHFEYEGCVMLGYKHFEYEGCVMLGYKHFEYKGCVMLGYTHFEYEGCVVLGYKHFEYEGCVMLGYKHFEYEGCAMLGYTHF